MVSVEWFESGETKGKEVSIHAAIHFIHNPLIVGVSNTHTYMEVCSVGLYLELATCIIPIHSYS